MTAVAGNYDPYRPICEDDGTEEQYVREQESFGEGPFDVYLHGNAAMMLARGVRKGGSMKVVVSSTKGMFFPFQYPRSGDCLENGGRG